MRKESNFKEKFLKIEKICRVPGPQIRTNVKSEPDPFKSLVGNPIQTHLLNMA